jgi:bifunctional enzyme CysN/CysC
VSKGNGILRFLACGSVDDGKSTLIGHLLHLTGELCEDHLRMLELESMRIGTASGVIDYSLLLDGLMAEREQGITIDVAYRYFGTPGRKFIVADTPGHERYTRNMATGASQCNAALILMDACQGVLRQTRRHALICALMGIRHFLFVVNKMDMAGWAEHVFRNVESQCGLLTEELARFGLHLAECVAVPASALHGDNLVALSVNMPWYGGTTVMEWLQSVRPWKRPDNMSPRFPVQYVIKVPHSGNAWQNGISERFGHGLAGTYRSYAGSLVSGRMKCGDKVVVLPSGLRTRVKGIWQGDVEMREVTAGMAVSLTLEGEHDISRGDVIAPEGSCPEMAHLFKVRLVWMDENPLYAGRHYLFKSLSGTVTAEITRIRSRIDLGSYQRLAADRLSLNDIGEVEMALSRRVPFDPYHKNRETGGFILTDRLSNATMACGMILHAMRRSGNVHWQCGEVERRERAAIKGQQPCVLWLTGLSGAGKSTIANFLERRLHGMGRHTMLLDGDNIRHGLNKDLGFTEAGRIENIRRIGEVAKLMTDAGLIVITAFISPFRAERDMVRRLLPHGEFIEIHVNTPMEECERRDPKGLYRKARMGEIPNFTGINSPYEIPENPEIRLDASIYPIEESAEVIIRYLNDHKLL